MKVPGDGDPVTQVNQILGLQTVEVSDVLILNPLLKRILNDFNDGLLKVTKRSFKSGSEKELVDICLGTYGMLLTKEEETVLADIEVKLGCIGYDDGTPIGGSRSAYDFIAMRRDLSVGLMMIAILAKLPSEETPFEQSEKSFSELKIPSFILSATYYENGIYITKCQKRDRDGRVSCQDNSVAVNEDGLTLIPLVGVFSNEGSDYPSSQLIFESMNTFIQWCEENNIIKKYRELEKKVYGIVRKAWLKNLPDYEPSNGMSPEMDELN